MNVERTSDAPSLTSKKTSKLFVPVENTVECNVVLCGILEQLVPGESTRGRRLALILHGSMGFVASPYLEVLAKIELTRYHRHKDYLFQKRLALSLPVDSFRFDFRGNHESTGTATFAGFKEDIEDIAAVAAHLSSQYGYVIDLVVAHSRAVCSAMKWMCTSVAGSEVRTFVNVSGRYRMETVYNLVSPTAQKELDARGYSMLKAVVAGKRVEIKTTKEDVETYANFDVSHVWTDFPNETHVLGVHGLKDQVSPASDNSIYARALGNRQPGTYSLCYLEGADHNYTGFTDNIVNLILDWYHQAEYGVLKTGVWQTGTRGELSTETARL
ncbi:hypothetical protein EIP91_002867 [Steccherinum ochraceum]|uniref:Peptidase S9 prolyl oligopeptidase catalytic domain-containing protein n=1 Tax=Steccherinum ochraceum TaxID=92696 RepID=A0A4R0RTG3_9APHY|nr:hypothetical protein EIP91_002867 [Steccherinum ochraceum]